MSTSSPGGRPVNANAEILNALQALTEQLRRNLDYVERENRGTDPSISPLFRERQQAHLDVLAAANAVQSEVRSQQGEPGSWTQRVPSPTPDRPLNNPPPPPPPPPVSLRDKVRVSRTTYNEHGFRAALGEMAGRLDSNGDPIDDDTASYPPNASQGGPQASGPATPASTGSGGTNVPPMPTPHRVPNPQTFLGDANNQQMFTWAMLGEHGGPAFARNFALEQWGLNQSLNWAHQNLGGLGHQMDTGNVPDFMQSMGVNRQNVQTVQDALNIARSHPLATYAAYRAVRPAFHALADIPGHLNDWEAEGAQLGVPTSSNRYLFGIRNPLSPFASASTTTGEGAAIDRQILQGRVPGHFFGSGLSGQQATDIVQSIMQQGYGANENMAGGGDIGSISQQFMGPLMQQNPGLQAQDLGQFLGMLRNSGTSITQLRTSLQDLGSAARATHETVGQAAGSMHAFVESTQGMGTQQGRMNIAQGFRNATGIDPQIAGQMMQNPLVQGMAMSRYGVLPSGMGDMNPGAATGIMSQSLNMLMNATRGLNQNVYGTVNGRRTLIETGQNRQMDQVAQMMGVDPAIVRRMVGQQQGDAARNNIVTALTGPSGFEAMTHSGSGHETNAQRNAAQQYWNTNIANQWQHTGISHQEMNRLSHEGFSRRIRDLHDDLNKANAASTWSQVQQNPNSQTVSVKFTGLAAKYFQQAGPTTAKQAANAGQSSVASVANSILGDVGQVGAGAGIGAAVGSVVPGIGTLAGAGIGGVAGLASALNPF